MSEKNTLPTVDQTAVTVKSLEWHGDQYVGWSAHGVGFRYYIDDESGEEECFILEKHEGSSVLKSAHQDLATAQAHAQAHFEAEIKGALEGIPPGDATGASYQALACTGLPADCCDFGVISMDSGKEICRVWNEDDARTIANLLNRDSLIPAAEDPLPPANSDRNPPELFSEAERKEIFKAAEWLWKDLQENKLGGFSGINRPFYILQEFKRIIEQYGRRDVGLNWSKNELDAITPAQRAEPTTSQD